MATCLHADGTPCPVVAFAEEHFGDRYWDVLMNETCFPMDDVTAMEQLKALVAVQSTEEG